MASKTLTAKNFSDLMDYSATSVRTMKNSAGQVGIAPNNLIKASEDFSDSNWVKSDTTVTSNAAAAPDGTITADKISHTSTAAALYQAVTVVSGTSYRSGYLFKYIDHQWMRFALDGTNVWVDLQNQALGTDNLTNTTLTVLADDWLYVEASYTAGDTSCTFTISMVDGDGSTTETSGTEAYIWGAHLYENGLAGMLDVPEDQRALASLTKYLPNKAVVTGPNLVSNGTFDADSDWTKGTGWTIGTGVASKSGSAGSSDYLEQTVANLEDGEFYRIEFTISNLSTSVDVGISSTGAFGSLAGADRFTQSDGKHVLHGAYSSGDGTSIRFVGSTSPVTFDIDNITVTKVDRDPTAARFLPRRNNHEYIDGAWVKGLKVESEARTNNFTQALDFSDADWTLDGDTVVAAGGAFGLTSFTLTEATATYAGVYQSVTLTAVPWTTWCVAKSGTSDDLRIRYGGSTNRNADFDLSDGSVAAVDGSSTAGTVALGNGYYLCWHTTTPTAGATNTAINCANGAIELVCAQAEAGSTPSSIIPTYGATRTRTSETFTQKSDKIIWPNTTYVDGTELVTNGTFDSDVTGWTDNSVGTGTVSAATGAAVHTAGASGNEARMHQQMTVDVGSVYEVTFTTSSITAANALVRVGTTNTGSDGFLHDADTEGAGTHTEVFVATASTYYFNTYAINGDITIDNISVKEINPRALCVALHGYMTYAESASATQDATFWRQYADADNNFYAYLTTATGRSGRVTFLQEVNSTVDFLETDDNLYAGGINVPFKIASRHLDNAIQGAADGTATTENTTPPGLPDLSATQAEWFYDFMGHVTDLRVWTQDITEAGLTGATS